MRPLAYVGIGANLGDARATVRAACERLRPLGALRCSSLYRSAPVDAGGPDFVNAVVELQPTLDPAALLAALQAIEADFGRERPFRHAPRTLDLDLLLYGDEVVGTPSLTLPHPRLHQRAFVLQPLLELAPALQAPGLGALSAWLPATAGQGIERLAG
ncbi:2-amino-4-hydroxy-6-hydroxymethyldihydropteridine diphosphokinase [Aquabacterium humicola]|uniref:2-amino-4-hydroxy-6- hydroxymethyldihydropteridine diphosphokinase n=1 Tax=Aquabacterium humicola TaxID=3237377 RepID=UPI002543CAC7|nr:2-amino-4-hydroxy-6-hydroxymethyldihydropteridine diphosphokinase [Rubrivivax pictus]